MGKPRCEIRQIDCATGTDGCCTWLRLGVGCMLIARETAVYLARPMRLGCYTHAEPGTGIGSSRPPEADRHSRHCREWRSKSLGSRTAASVKFKGGTRVSNDSAEPNRLASRPTLKFNGLTLHVQRFGPIYLTERLT